MSFVSKAFPEELVPPGEIEARYPERGLLDGALVTRVGPSPTGMMHIGTLYVGLLNSLLAHQSGGSAILRIEDTDKLREVDGASNFIAESLKSFGIDFDEGSFDTLGNLGEYGPYIQSQRKEIYHSFAKFLLESGKAYLCFATTEELEQIREKQGQSSARTGYYGEWAIWREKPAEAVADALNVGLPWVLRFRSEGKHVRKIAFTDDIFGKREMAENDHDIVILKSDGVPTYHFAHVVDDHLMRTTHVIRGDEWLASVPMHLQLFEAFGWRAPRYAHVAPINKVEGVSRRKLSKRRDPEASVRFFEEQGFPKNAILEYLLSLADSGFEQWRMDNPTTSLFEFPLSLESFQAGGGPIFDFDKLDHVSKEYVSQLTAVEVFDLGVGWATKHDTELAARLSEDPDYARAALSIERGGEQARKDIRKWSDLRSEIGYFFDDWFDLTEDKISEQLSFIELAEINKLAQDFLKSFDLNDERTEWFSKMKNVAVKHGFAARPRDFKRNPEAYKGSIAHAAQVFRVLLTGDSTSPDLFSVMQVMGLDRLQRRLSIGLSL